MRTFTIAIAEFVDRVFEFVEADRPRHRHIHANLIQALQFSFILTGHSVFTNQAMAYVRHTSSRHRGFTGAALLAGVWDIFS